MVRYGDGMKLLWRLLVSIELCLVLLALICGGMAIGSFCLSNEYGAAINAMPLLVWLREVPAGAAWWLWVILALLLLLVVNTVACSFETLRSRWGKGGVLPMISPQFIHAGFLLIVVAHLLSAVGADVQQVEVGEGMTLRIPQGMTFGIAAIEASFSSRGMPTAMSAELVTDLRTPEKRVTISPNHPWFSGGYGVYLKQAELFPFKRVLLELHREPGAGMALAGAILFTIGNVILLYLRSQSREV